MKNIRECIERYTLFSIVAALFCAFLLENLFVEFNTPGAPFLKNRNLPKGEFSLLW